MLLTPKRFGCNPAVKKNVENCTLCIAVTQRTGKHDKIPFALIECAGKRDKTLSLQEPEEKHRCVNALQSCFCALFECDKSPVLPKLYHVKNLWLSHLIGLVAPLSSRGPGRKRSNLLFWLNVVEC